MINGLELLNEIADRLGKPQFTTLEKPQPISEHRKLIRLLNTVLKTLGAFNDWPLLRKEEGMTLVASLETDADSSEYVTTTQNSDVVTVAGQTFDETFMGRAFQVNADEEIFRIKAINSLTELQLDKIWTQDSLAVSDEKTVTIGMDRYALPTDFGRTVDNWQNFFAPYNIKHVTPNELREVRRTERRIRLADPEIYTVFGVTTGGHAQVVHFHPWPENARVLRYEYQQNHPMINSDQDNILYPLSYREALIDMVLHIANRDYEDSAKMEKVMMDAIRSHNMQQSNPGLHDSKVRLEPSGETRADIYASYGDPPMNIDWGDAFDTGRIFGL